tara:strand:- start:292 stop:789 length:498 start_codon:yes stop_codon:yes gene_type:complete
MKDLLKEIIGNSRWTYPAFDGKLIIEGRILSPTESEVTGLTAALIANSITTKDDLRKLQEFGNVTEESEEEKIQKLFEVLQNFDADKILEMAISQDKILSTCITRASMDEGKTWSTLQIVQDESKQSAQGSRLWVGMLTDEDRKNMIELCMDGHKKASKSIRGLV